MIDLLRMLLTLGLVWCVIMLEGFQIKESSLERKLREKIGLGWNGKKRKKIE
ncbi:MAG: hypothetical protein KAU62_00670 [Candidatus Heimdallarchaeota archaeon]|nr:hypothetical protein [Candidatus Heimdallarchaeota archaeon]MCK4609645.1 hypothetical protein [Candidatus Heimdallarchaeota archaeon]